MGLLTFAINITLDGCIDHREGLADDELHRYWTALMDGGAAMLWGRVTYEMMEGAWPAVARDTQAPAAMREWTVKLDAKPKYVVSTSRRDYSWSNTHLVEGDLREAVTKIKESPAEAPRPVRTPRATFPGAVFASASPARLSAYSASFLRVSRYCWRTLVKACMASPRSPGLSCRRSASSGNGAVTGSPVFRGVAFFFHGDLRLRGFPRPDPSGFAPSKTLDGGIGT